MVSMTPHSTLSCILHRSACMILLGCETAFMQAFAVHRPGLPVASNRQKRTGELGARLCGSHDEDCVVPLTSTCIWWQV